MGAGWSIEIGEGAGAGTVGDHSESQIRNASIMSILLYRNFGQGSIDIAARAPSDLGIRYEI